MQRLCNSAIGSKCKLLLRDFLLENSRRSLRIVRQFSASWTCNKQPQCKCKPTVSLICAATNSSPAATQQTNSGAQSAESSLNWRRSLVDVYLGCSAAFCAAGNCCLSGRVCAVCFLTALLRSTVLWHGLRSRNSPCSIRVLLLCKLRICLKCAHTLQASCVALSAKCMLSFCVFSTRQSALFQPMCFASLGFQMHFVLKKGVCTQ